MANTTPVQSQTCDAMSVKADKPRKNENDVKTPILTRDQIQRLVSASAASYLFDDHGIGLQTLEVEDKVMDAINGYASTDPKFGLAGQALAIHSIMTTLSCSCYDLPTSASRRGWTAPIWPKGIFRLVDDDSFPIQEAHQGLDEGEKRPMDKLRFYDQMVSVDETESMVMRMGLFTDNEPEVEVTCETFPSLRDAATTKTRWILRANVIEDLGHCAIVRCTSDIMRRAFDDRARKLLNLQGLCGDKGVMS